VVAIAFIFRHIQEVFLLFCSGAGVISEIITIAMPNRIVGMLQRDPDEIIHNGFYRFMFLLSSFYLLAIFLMFFSGYGVFKIYGLILLLNSFFIWIARKLVLRYRVMQVAESTLCLILLLDVIRTVGRSLM
jgi:hypothetical protein